MSRHSRRPATRCSGGTRSRASYYTDSMQFGGYRVDEVHRTVTAPAGRGVRLEPKAFDLLVYFAAPPEGTLSKEGLVAGGWGGEVGPGDAGMGGGGGVGGAVR